MANRKNYNNSNSDYVKRSGAVYSKISKGNFQGSTIVNAWNKSQGRGLLTATVAPYKNSSLHETKGGLEYQTMICVLHYHNSGIEKKIPVLMNTSTRVISIPEIGMVITPNGSGKTSSGKHVKGYFGKFTKS